MAFDLEQIISLIRRGRPRRPRQVDGLDLPLGVEPWNPNAGIDRSTHAPPDRLLQDYRAPAVSGSPRRVLPPQMPAVIPDTLTTRPRRVTAGRPARPDDEFSPYVGSRPQGSFVGDGAAPIARSLPPARPVVMAEPTRAPYDDVPPPYPERPARDLNAPFGSSGEPFGSVRPRRAEPRDFLADAVAYLREVENQPVERNRLKSAGAGLIEGGIPGALVGITRPERYGETKKQREIARATGQLNRELALQTHAADIDYRNAQTEYARQRPEIAADRVQDQQRRALQTRLTSMYNSLQEFNPDDPANADLVQAFRDSGLPPPAAKSRANQLRFVQDARTGAWNVISGDRSTGEAVGRPIPQSPTNWDEAIEQAGGTLTTTSPSQIASEDRAANRLSREQIAEANRQSRETIAELNRRSRATDVRTPGGAKTSARLSQAAAKITKLEELRIQALDPLKFQDQATNLSRMAVLAQELKSVYGDILEVGSLPDTAGRQWPYAKTKEQPASRPDQRGTNYRGRTMSRASLERYARDKGLTLTEARQQVESQGVRVQ